MKYFRKILISLLLLILISFGDLFAGVVDIPWSTEIQRVSIGYSGGGDGLYAINNVWFSILTTIKTILMRKF